MNIVLFAHSLRSCWNHGNAHFLRGILRELTIAGHRARACQPAKNWSESNLVADHGSAALEAFSTEYPELSVIPWRTATDIEAAVADADLVLVHEWNEPPLIAHLGRLRQQGGRFLLLFHDTHHRAVSDPAAMRRLDLSGYDGVLAFGEALAQVYRRWGWHDDVFVWHEAADTRLFRPPTGPPGRDGIVWIGNWGDDERSAELEAFLLRPCRALDLPLDIHGVRYPEKARRRIEAQGARYHGWLPNTSVPDVFARHAATIHVPRRFYAQALPGIPTIRVFEALACGIPLLCAPWHDAEGLFSPGKDYLVARDGADMQRLLAAVIADAGLRQALSASGLSTIRARHSCAHRVRELLAIVARLRQPALSGAG